MKFWSIESVEKKLANAKAKNQIVIQDFAKENAWVKKMHGYGFKLAYDELIFGDKLTNERVFNRLLKNMTGIKIASMRGKLKDLISLSTNACMNSKCQERILTAKEYMDNHPEDKDYDCICLHCYAIKFLSGDDIVSSGAFKNQQLNYDKLTGGYMLTWDCIPVWFNREYFRFESHGDLQDEWQLINYIAICEKSLMYGSKTKFALWTKNVDILEKVFCDMGIHKPANLQILVSSCMLNTIEMIPLHVQHFVDKIFTVWSDESFDVSHVDFNCCDYRSKSKSKGRKCKECHICYEKNDVKFVNELIKPGTNRKDYLDN